MDNQLFNDPYYNLWVLLRQTTDIIFKARGKELRQYGITVRQAAILFIIQAIGGKATLTQIANWLFREPHSVSAVLMRMEKDGLINRVKKTGKGSKISFTIADIYYITYEMCAT